MAPAIAAMAISLFRMIGCMIGSLAMIRSGSRRQAIHPIHAAPHRSGEHGDLTAAIFSIFDERTGTR
jgi:hypothetical protein